jgi:Zn-dependent peptidase ImmA (M78 family)
VKERDVSHESIVDSLAAGDRSHGSADGRLPRDFLLSTVDFAVRYARLEKVLFGGPRVAYSPAALQLDLSPHGDPVVQGEQLADAERDRFDLESGPILELGWLIEDQGIKILARPFPERTTARGGFFFDSALGPCILVDSAAAPVQRDYAIAHQYGHFLADYDPYITTICGHPGPPILDDVRELRAHTFALAFLAPRRDLEAYRKAFGLALSEPITADFVRQLQVYFALDFETVFWRLLSMGWIDPQHIETLLRENTDFTSPVDVDRMDADERVSFLGYPERFVHLVASGFGRGLLELEDAAAYLDTDLEGARHVLEQFHYEDRESPVAPSPAPRSAQDAPPGRPHPN